MGKKTQHYLLLLLCASGLVPRSAAVVFWTAVVEMSYNNQTVDKYCECGVFGRNSPLEKASGVLTVPTGDPRGCGPHPVYIRNASSPPWIALIKRGNCTFSEKINAAKRQGAAGVLVYNLDGSGNGTTHMAHSEASGIVAVMVGNILGTEMYKLVKNGSEVQMLIDVGNPHGPWMESYWLYFLSITFLLVSAVGVTYLVFISATRLYNLNRHRRVERRLKNEAKKAIGRLQVRTLKKDDVETSGDSDMCAVCIESYKAGEVVTVLTCDHIFHKGCIEPWLLERRTCPMCKCDILKALGVDEEMKDDISMPPDVTVVTVAGGDPLYEVPLTDHRGLDVETRQHRYDNRAFEDDEEAPRG